MMVEDPRPGQTEARPRGEDVNRIAETDRLLLREFVEDDAEAFLAWNGDPEVMRYTGEPRSESVEQVRCMIRGYPDYGARGYGRWAVVYKPDDRVIGFNGLKYLGDLDETDLGFRFLADYWGRGIATESSLAVLRYGFDTLKLERVIGLVLPENGGSLRVLEKVGMCYEDIIDYCDDEVQRWSISHRP
jgi:RimJ/RimL family protein N-acetyltransferase